MDPSLAVGDLAHTIVVERLEELSHHLQATDQGPLFIISAVNYDNYLAKVQPSYGKGKGRLPPRPSDRGGQRGEIDVLLLHKKGGVVLIEVKATGNSSWTSSKAELQLAIQRCVQKAEKQLIKGRDTLHRIMPDLHLPHVTLVVALPYVTRQQLTQAVSILSLDSNLRFLCKDDLSPLISECPTSTSQTEEVNAGRSVQAVDIIPDLLTWWRNMVCVEDSEDFAVDSMKTIVGRICGLMSVVSVWTTSKPRMEVWTPAQAIGESGRRLADIVLLPCQAELLAQPSLHRLWLTGPMGSGKTLLLQLKGRQWLKEGRRVIIMNVRTVSRGRPHGHVLEQGIRQEMETHSGTGSVERHDVALNEFQLESLQRELTAGGSTENACFVVDEVLSAMSIIIQKLVEHYPHSPIWCAAIYVSPVPNTFQCFRLHTVLRNPPSIQLMLKEMDLNPKHKSAYTTRSAARGLPCDGPPVIFIEHLKHNTHVRHLDCQQCANELVNIFNEIGLKLHPPTPEGGDHSSSKHREAAALSFRDVLVLGLFPFTSFRQVRDFHWEPSMPDVLQYIMYLGSSHFLSVLRQRGVPFKFALNTTLKEIAFPPEDEVIFTDIWGAHSLERKVVVFLRTGLPLTQEEITEHISRYQTVQAASSSGHQTVMSSIQELSKVPMDKETVSKQLHVFASLLYEIRDIIYPELNLSPSPSPEEAKAIFYNLFGKMSMAGTQSFSGHQRCEEGLHGPHIQPTLQRTPPSIESRCGMEYRCDWPMLTLPGLFQNQAEATGVSCDEGLNDADSALFVPDQQEDMEQRQGEVKRIQRAMESLSEDDLDWEFFAASRCLSQYITILY